MKISLLSSLIGLTFVMPLLITYSTAAAVASEPSFSPTESMGTSRQNHTETLLSDGRVLVTAGYNNGNVLDFAESWTTAGRMGSVHEVHRATLLQDGRVLVTGGGNLTEVLDVAELFDPTIDLQVSDPWSFTASMSTPRRSHTSTLLDGGGVLVTGGSPAPGVPDTLNSAELFDPLIDPLVADPWASVSAMAAARKAHTATLLENGKVLVVGGIVGFSTALASAEIYNPATDSWSPAGNVAHAR